MVKRQSCADASGDTFFLFDSEAREWGTDLIEEYPGGGQASSDPPKDIGLGQSGHRAQQEKCCEQSSLLRKQQ